MDQNPKIMNKKWIKKKKKKKKMNNDEKSKNGLFKNEPKIQTGTKI